MGADIGIEQIKLALFDMGMELEGLVEDDLTVEITAERLDLLSVQGLARALKCYLGLTANTPKYETYKSNYEVLIKEPVKQVRPHTVCAIIKNLHLDDVKIKQIIDVQEKLHNTLGRNRSRQQNQKKSVLFL